jgi:hypothetical protein
VEGDDHREAYTAILQGELLSPEKHNPQRPRPLTDAEGNMCDAAMRGVDALPWSKTSSRTKGLRRNLGDLMSGRAVDDRAGPHRGGEEP